MKLAHISTLIISMVLIPIMTFADAKPYTGDIPQFPGSTYYIEEDGSVFTSNFRWLGDIELHDVDLESFDVISGIFAKDKNHIYAQGTTLTGADITSFRVIGKNFAKDNTHIYWTDMTLSGADIATFRPLSFLFWKDKNAVYFYGKRLEGADTKSFRVIFDGHGNSPSYSKDKNTVYEDFTKTTYDVKTFKRIYDYNIDKNGVSCAWQYHEKIENVDLKTFVPLSQEYSKDKNNLYKNCVRVDKK